MKIVQDMQLHHSCGVSAQLKESSLLWTCSLLRNQDFVSQLCSAQITQCMMCYGVQASQYLKLWHKPITAVHIDLLCAVMCVVSSIQMPLMQ